jgi:hypothetical protein
MDINQVISETIQKRPMDVSVLCKKYNYFGLPTVEAIKDLYILHGDPFLMDFFQILYYQANNFFGEKLINRFSKKSNTNAKSNQPFYPTPDGQPINAEAGKEKKSFWDKLKDGIDKAVGIAGGVTQILNPILGNNGNDQNNAPKPEPEEKKILGMSQGLFFGVVVIVVIVIVVVIVKKK